ncbi:MAG: hypothetical protein WCF85_15520 [Rhodospirillaceae bacterium]
MKIAILISGCRFGWAFSTAGYRVALLFIIALGMVLALGSRMLVVAPEFALGLDAAGTEAFNDLESIKHDAAADNIDPEWLGAAAAVIAMADAFAVLTILKVMGA